MFMYFAYDFSGFTGESCEEDKKINWVRWQRPLNEEVILFVALRETTSKRGAFVCRALKNEKETHLWVQGVISDKSSREGETVWKCHCVLVWPELMGTMRCPARTAQSMFRTCGILQVTGFLGTFNGKKSLLKRTCLGNATLIHCWR